MTDFIDKTRDEFDANILANANMYSCCVFLGRGKYTTAYFLTQREAEECKAKLLARDPHTRVLIYAMIIDDETPNRIQQTLVV